MATVITRTGYCEKCAAQQRPFKGNLFLAYGTHRAAYYVRSAKTTGIPGYVPHLFILKDIVNNICYVEKICCMYGCGVEIRSDDKYAAKKDDWLPIEMSIIDWNSLLMSNRDGQYYI